MTGYSLRLEPEAFLATHWQREHLYIAAGIPDFEPPADAGELAGLALEEGVDSRIVRRVRGDAGDRWQQQRGPFRESDFQSPGAWTLLVQSVDHYWEEAAALLGAVNWLPGWRLDDVMMSYATEQGSAGPHFDNYDVFIIQGEGERLWQIGDRCDANTPLLPHAELQLLNGFRARHEYLMGPGDVLYVPPGLAHFGVSIGESTSFSIGFRAPRMSDLLARWADNRLESLDARQLLVDPRREAAQRPGEISVADLDRARAQLLALFEDPDPRWFGEVVTAAGVGEQGDIGLLPASTDGHAWATRSPGGRIAWFDDGEELMVFACGGSRRMPAGLAGVLQTLCAGESLAVDELLGSPHGGGQLLTWLLEEGALILHD